MKTKILSLSLITFLSFSVQAQFGGLMDKAKKKAEEKAEKKAQDKMNNQESKKQENSNSGTNSTGNSTVQTNDIKTDEQKTNQNNSTIESNPNSNNVGKANETSETKKEQSIQTNNNKKFEDDGITSEAHKMNLGKVVFSKKPIEKGNEKIEDFISEVSGKDLYYRFYLENSFYNTLIFPTYQYGSQEPKNNPLCNFYIEVLIDGVTIKDIPEFTSIGIKPHLYEETSNYEMSHNFSQEQRLARAKSTTESFSFSMWPLFANYMKPGEHLIKLNVWAGSEEYASYKSKVPVATGEFKYTKKVGDHLPFGVAWSSIAKKPAMINANLQAQMKQTIEEDTHMKCVKLIIIDKDWTITKNSFGNIEGRQITVQYVVKDSHGYCTEEYAGMAQDYYKGTYGRMRTTGASSNEGPVFIDCSTVK